jgi:hypothetical protein
MDFYRMKRENGFYIDDKGDGCRLLIPQEDIIQVALYLLQPHKGPRTRRKKK